MLEITDPAREWLARMVSDADVTAALAARIHLAPKGFSIYLDKVARDDHTFTHNGRIILVLDAEAVQGLAAHTLDVRESEGTTVLALR